MERSVGIRWGKKDHTHSCTFETTYPQDAQTAERESNALLKADYANGYGGRQFENVRRRYPCQVVCPTIRAVCTSLDRVSHPSVSAS